jgi:hypothetical protein
MVACSDSEQVITEPPSQRREPSLRGVKLTDSIASAILGNYLLVMRKKPRPEPKEVRFTLTRVENRGR